MKPSRLRLNLFTLVFASLRTYAIWEKNIFVLAGVLILGLIYPGGFTVRL